jgi:hypothetical protein
MNTDHDAIQSYGRAKDKAEAKRWITRRARELNAEKELSEDWWATTSLSPRRDGAAA